MGKIACGTTIGRKYGLTRENLAIAANAGIERVEIAFFSGSLDYRDAAVVAAGAKVLAASGVVARSVHLDFGDAADISLVDDAARERAVEAAVAGVKAAPELGAEIAVVHSSDEPVADAERELRIGFVREGLGVLCKAAEVSGVRLALELLPRTCLGHTTEEALGIVRGLPEERIGFCLDVNHINLREDPAEAVRRLGGRIITFHISDNDGVDERHWFPFEGVIDWKAFMKAVRGIGYEGQFIFETSGSMGEDVVAYARELRARFERLMDL